MEIVCCDMICYGEVGGSGEGERKMTTRILGGREEESGEGWKRD